MNAQEARAAADAVEIRDLSVWKDIQYSISLAVNTKKYSIQWNAARITPEIEAELKKDRFKVERDSLDMLVKISW